jgi:hypothetical protein
MPIILDTCNLFIFGMQSNIYELHIHLLVKNIAESPCVNYVILS